MTMWKFFFKIMKKAKFWFIASSLLALAPKSLSSISHIYFANIISLVGQNPSDAFSSKVLYNVLTLALIYIFIDTINALRIKIDTRMKILYQRIAQIELFKQTHKHSATFFNTEQTGVVIGKFGSVYFGICQLFGNTRAFLLPELALTTTSIIILLNVNVQMGLTIVFVDIICAYLITKHLKPIYIASKNKENEYNKVNGLIVDSIANARLVKNTSSIYHETKTIRQQLNKSILQAITHAKTVGIFHSLQNFYFTLSSVIKFSIILYFYLHYNLNLKDVVLALTISTNLNESIFRIGDFLYMLQGLKGQIDNGLELLYRPVDITDDPNAKKLKIKENSICLKNISFQYTKDRPLFLNLNLTIEPNQKIGLVGLSGSGKSTLINLILRSYDVEKGKILISNQDISKVTLFSLHQNISIISQEPCLFNRSIMENLQFANKNASKEEIINACKLAYIHDVIQEMPQGYDSIIGERGVKLSGGERQRIAIAQAILKNAPILILDEATSALDSNSEFAIEKALKNIMQNKTVITIAHRLSTLKNMDKIIVLEKGKIVEQGTQKELLSNKNGTFHHLYKLQSEGYLK